MDAEYPKGQGAVRWVSPSWLEEHLDEARVQILDRHHVNPDNTVICSCGTGREATNEFILLKFYLGYPDVKLYEGSFTEWSSYPDNPVVTGPNPR